MTERVEPNEDDREVAKAINAATDRPWYPTSRVAEFIAAYRVKLQAEARREALELLDRMHEALIFCSGSPDFAKGGQAELGWDRCCRPVLSDMQDHYAARRALGESEPEKLPLGHEFVECSVGADRCHFVTGQGHSPYWCGQPRDVHRRTK